MEKLLELKELILEKKYYVIGGILFLLLLGCSIYFCYQKLNSNDKQEIVFLEEDSEIKQEELIEEKEDCYVNVDIKGEVNNPGLYQIECNGRVNDVINKAGGVTKNGNTSILNLGKKVNDEMVIIVYAKKEIEKTYETKQEIIEEVENCINKTEIRNDACIEIKDLNNITTNDNQNNNINDEIITDTPVMVLVSINKASKEELMTLSGIGESKANNIISYRNENNGFKSLEEIKNVKGIGDSIFEKIKDSITL